MVVKTQAQFEPHQLLVINTTMEEARALEQALATDGIRIRSRRTLRELGLVMTVLRLPLSLPEVDTLRQLRARFPSLWIDFNHRYPLLESQRKGYAPRLIQWQPMNGCSGEGASLGLLD